MMDGSGVNLSSSGKQLLLYRMVLLIEDAQLVKCLNAVWTVKPSKVILGLSTYNLTLSQGTFVLLYWDIIQLAGDYLAINSI